MRKDAQFEMDSLSMENYFLLGEHFSTKQKNDSAFYYYFKSTQAIDTISNQREVDIYYATYYKLKALSKFGDCYALASEFEKKIPPRSWKYFVYASFFRENIAKSEKKFEIALNHNKDRLGFLNKIDETKIHGSALISRADIYYYLKKKERTYAILDSLILQEQKLDRNFKRQLYGNYAVYMYFDNQFEESLRFNQKALENIRAHAAPDFEKNTSLATAYANIAEIHIELKNYELAQKYIDSIYRIGFEKISRKIVRSTLNYQLRLQSLSGKIDMSNNRLLDSIFNYQDRLYQKKYNEELIALKIETEKKEKIAAERQATEIRNIQLRNRMIVLSILLLLIITIGTMFFFIRKYRTEKKHLYLQQRLLRAQMSPHFMFNTLSSIHNLMSANTEKASKYLLKFSGLLRLVLENSLVNYVDIDSELDSIKQYLELQLLRFPDRFTYEIATHDLSPESNYSIPPMLLQPFVENAIEHGFSGIDYPGKIQISMTKKNKYLQCVIEDNGRGIQDSKDTSKRSISTELISEFLEKTTGANVEISPKNGDNLGGPGVVVSFLIPYKIN
ncbi:histidine kinase [Aureisphaera galaxeae]|uniref:histidine kinase n=1 Tax=Aureisphaera galaxeae TaxID=1538023 RepID=UPI002350F282|nr:histidine kinase [Aureisphaera galaxeae]MDC8006045.1 histidine kinase [Aureisphaera galaxeae]